MLNQFTTVVKAIFQLKRPLLFPVVKPVLVMSVIISVVFSVGIDRLLTSQGIIGKLIVIALLFAHLMSMASMAQKVPQILWVQDHQNKSIGYLRSLPVRKLHSWLALNVINIGLRIIGGVGLIVFLMFTFPFGANLINGSWEYSGIAWWMNLFEDKFFQYLGYPIILSLFIFVVIGVLVGGVFVPTAKRGATNFNYIFLIGKRVKSENVIGVSFVIFLILAAICYLWDIPYVILAAYYVIHLVTIYLLSYLVFSGTNLSLINLKKILSVSVVMAALATGILSAVLYHGIKSKEFGFRAGSYLILKPVGSTRFVDGLISDLREVSDNRSYEILQLYLFIAPKQEFVARKTHLRSMLDSANCFQQKLLLPLSTLNSERNDVLLPYLIDTEGNAIMKVDSKEECVRSEPQIAELMYHALSVDRQGSYILHALESSDRSQRIVAANLSAKVPFNDISTLARVRQQLISNIDKVCDSSLADEYAVSEIATYNRALMQLFLTLYPDATKLANDQKSDCVQQRDLFLKYWQEKLKADELVNISHTQLLNEQLNLSNELGIDVQDASKIRESEFKQLLQRPEILKKLPEQVKCHLAQQWKLVRGIPNGSNVGSWISWPRDGFSLMKLGDYKALFSDANCG